MKEPALIRRVLVPTSRPPIRVNEINAVAFVSDFPRSGLTRAISFKPSFPGSLLLEEFLSRIQ